MDHLPWVMLGLRTAPKEEANVSPAEAALGTKLQLPGQTLPVESTHVPAADRPIIPRPVIPNTTKQAGAASPKGSQEGPSAGDLVYVRDGQPRGPLAPPYVGPYRVLERKGKAVHLLVGDREDWVAVERTKKHEGIAPVDPVQPPRRGRPPGRRS